MWENGKQHGKAIYTTLDNQEIQGFWVEGKRNRWIDD